MYGAWRGMSGEVGVSREGGVKIRDGVVDLGKVLGRGEVN